MLERADLVFAATLERWLLREVNGDGTEHTGLVRSLLAAQDMAVVTRTQGIVWAYERVLEVMRDIARQMNEPHERAPNVMGRPN